MNRFFIYVVAAAVAPALACQRAEDTRQVDTKTHTEETAAGEPIERESESAARMPNDGKVDRIDTEHNEYFGVVTKFTAGKTVSIKAADGETHTFDLDERGTGTTIAPAVKEGSKVKVTVHKGEGAPQTVKIVPQS